MSLSQHRQLALRRLWIIAKAIAMVSLAVSALVEAHRGDYPHATFDAVLILGLVAFDGQRKSSWFYRLLKRGEGEKPNE